MGLNIDNKVKIGLGILAFSGVVLTIICSRKAGVNPSINFSAMDVGNGLVAFIPKGSNYTQLRWDFGDNTFATTSSDTVFHPYKKNGEYNVTVYAYPRHASANETPAPNTVEVTSIEDCSVIFWADYSLYNRFGPITLSCNDEYIGTISKAWRYNTDDGCRNPKITVLHETECGEYEYIGTTRNNGTVFRRIINVDGKGICWKLSDSNVFEQ